MFRLTRMLMAPAALALAFLASPAAADTLDSIKAKGELVVGTKIEFPPFGFRDKDGQIAGIEPDLAADLAKRLGVRLRIEPVLPSNRAQLLREGKVDVLIATTVITEERRSEMGFVDPPYYAAGVAGLAAPGSGIQSEADLKNKSVCAIKGNFFNEDLKSQYVQRDLLMSNDAGEAGSALRERRCSILVFNEAMLRSMKVRNEAAWKDYHFFVLSEVDPRPVGIAVKLEDRSSRYARFISAVITDWHKSGFLAETEKKWLGSNSMWVAGVREKYKSRR
jgi:polar amino acid transport system substrate-binding protein